MSSQEISKPIKILIVSTCHVLPTGMSETLRLVFGTLLEDYPGEYEVHEVGLFLTGGVIEPIWQIHPTEMVVVDGRPRLNPSDILGQKTFPKVCRKIKPDLVFIFNDPQKLSHLCVDRAYRDYKLVLHTNIDSVPVAAFDTRFDLADRVVTVSKFALAALRNENYGISEKLSTYMYHPADTDRFQSLSFEERLECRQDLFPAWMPADAFVLGWVGQNQWRKQVWLPYKVIHYVRNGGYIECEDCKRVTLLNWDPIKRLFVKQDALVSESRPSYKFGSCSHCRSKNVFSGEKLDDVFLWMHMATDNPPTWSPSDLEAMYDLRPGRDIYYTEGLEQGASKGPTGLAPSDMPTLFQMWDTLLYLTGGEGFGIPPWEAMCCAIPVIYTNYSSHAEYLNSAEAGLPVGGMALPTPIDGPQYMVADAEQAVEAVLKLYRNRDLGKKLGLNGQQFVKKYGLKHQALRWRHLFNEVLEEDC